MDPDQAKIPTATRIVRRPAGGTPRACPPISACWAPASPEFPPRSKRPVSAARSRWSTAFPRSADRPSIPSSARSAGCSRNGHARRPAHPRHRRRHPARARRAGRVALPPRRTIEHDGGDVRRDRALALDRGGRSQGRYHRAARRHPARGRTRRRPHPRARSRDALRRREALGGRLRRRHRRRRPDLGGGICLPRAGRRSDLRHPDDGARRHRRSARSRRARS